MPLGNDRPADPQNWQGRGAPPRLMCWFLQEETCLSEDVHS